MQSQLTLAGAFCYVLSVVLWVGVVQNASHTAAEDFGRAAAYAAGVGFCGYFALRSLGRGWAILVPALVVLIGAAVLCFLAPTSF